MSQMLGMDIAGVRQLATQMNTKAEEIQSIATALSSALGSVQWVGNDATQFRSEWDGTLKSQLMQVSNALRDAATKANQNASDQESTSAR